MLIPVVKDGIPQLYKKQQLNLGLLNGLHRFNLTLVGTSLTKNDQKHRMRHRMCLKRNYGAFADSNVFYFGTKSRIEDIWL